MGLSEFELINRYFNSDDERLQRSELVLGIGDDAALLAPKPGHELVVAVDTLVSGVHFPADAGADDIGYRSLAVNLSDLAAMGAEPACFTLAITLPESNSEWLEGFSRGLFEMAKQHRVPLVGGDTTKGPLTISIQVLGYVPCGQALRRDGAQPGDLIYVSGYLGDAAAGLALANAQGTAPAYLQQRFLRPEPRLEAGLALRQFAHAAIDISDGLLADIGHIAERSGLSAAIELDKLPLSDALSSAFSQQQAQQFALCGGDDYELCFCSAPEHAEQLAAIAEQLKLPLTCIGQMREGAGVQLYDATGKRLETKDSMGYQHF